MQFKLLLLTITAALAILINPVTAQVSIPVFNRVLFYDGYQGTVNEPVPDGVIRHANYLYATRLTEKQLALIGDTLTMRVRIKASCDDYDRIGNVYMSLVPKGSSAYHVDSVPRMELARFITPFMNKNVRPDTVDYLFSAANVAALLRDASIRSRYDIWLELSVFGVASSAQQKIWGCAGRFDVFYGSLMLETGAPAAPVTGQVLMPLYAGHNMSNYKSEATDELGKTQLTKTFTLRQDLTDAAFFLITSNHGANAGGEEYNRRDHFVYLDGEQILTYKPGRQSCEPFRKSNTMGNGIYGPGPRSDEEWQSFSNWCPGDVITTRRINLGPLKAGTHTFRISVPAARFVNGEGYIPVSLYLQGRTSGYLGIDQETLPAATIRLFPNPATDVLAADAPDGSVLGLDVCDMQGRILRTVSAASVSVAGLPSGMYLGRISLAGGHVVYQKFLKQ